MTRLVAFPELADDVGDWLEPLGVVSVLAESTAVGIAAAAWPASALRMQNADDRS